MSSGIVAAFSPNDFYFMKATNMPDAQTCESLMSDPPTNCDKANAKKTNPACVNTELCKNKENANTLYNLQNNYGGSDQRYTDVKKMYDDALFNSFNLGVGIIISIGFIYTKYIYHNPPSI